MIVFYAVAIAILITAVSDFRKAFAFGMAFRLFLNQNIAVINSPGYPLLSLDTAFVSLMLLIYSSKSRLFGMNNEFRFKLPFLFIILSLFLSSIFSLAGFLNAISQALLIAIDYIWIWVMWSVIRDWGDVKYIYKLLLISFSVAVCYALFERFYGANPIIEYQISQNSNREKLLNWSYSEEERGIGGRIRSVFIHPIGAGVNMACMLFLISIYRRGGGLLRRSERFWTSIVWIGCFISVWLTNSRGPLLFLAIGIIPFVRFFSVSSMAVTIILSIIATQFNSSLWPYFVNLLSIFDSSFQDQVGGSDASMRLQQLRATIEIFSAHPIFGNGIKSLPYIENRALVDSLLGLESIWFRLMIERGLIGVIAYIFLLYKIVTFGKQDDKWACFFIGLAFIAVNTVTSLPGMLDYLFFFCLLVTQRSRERGLISNSGASPGGGVRAAAG